MFARYPPETLTSLGIDGAAPWYATLHCGKWSTVVTTEQRHTSPSTGHVALLHPKRRPITKNIKMMIATTNIT